MGCVRAGETPKHVSRCPVVILTLTGLMALAACGIDTAASSTAPHPATSTAPATSPAPSGDEELKSACADLKSVVDLQTIQDTLAIVADPSNGPRYRAGVAQTYQRFAMRLSLAAVTTGDPRLGASLKRWSDANQQVSAYVLATKPSGDNLVELGPGNDQEKAARAETGKICGLSFGTQ